MSSYKSTPAFEDAVPSSSIPASQTAQSQAPTGTAAVIAGELTAPAANTASSPRPANSRVQEALVPPPQVRAAGSLHPPATLKGIDYNGIPAGDVEWDESMGQADAVLELADGLALSGHSFGAKKSIAGECVFQTGTTTRYQVVSQSIRAHLLQEWSDTPNL